jgi:N-acetylmuramoyl-L-alanine amidase
MSRLRQLVINRLRYWYSNPCHENSFVVSGRSITNLSLARGSLFFLLLLMVSASALARPAVVVIDPGHGGSDRGGMPGQRLPEKGFTLDTAKRLARVLRSGTGIKVVLTRADDTFVSLTERTNIANQYAGRDAVFVSIHFNAGRREGAYGIETYYNNQRGYRLAALVHPRVIRAMASIDRGVRYRGYSVLRKNRLPAILVECGFLTNPAEAARISDFNSRERLARAIADAIVRYD